MSQTLTVPSYCAALSNPSSSVGEPLTVAPLASHRPAQSTENSIRCCVSPGRSNTMYGPPSGLRMSYAPMSEDMREATNTTDGLSGWNAIYCRVSYPSGNFARGTHTCVTPQPAATPKSSSPTHRSPVSSVYRHTLPRPV